MSKYLIINWLYHFISVHCPWEAKRQFSIISKTASRPLLVCGFGPQDGYLPPLFADQEVSCRHPICGQFVEETKKKYPEKWAENGVLKQIGPKRDQKEPKKGSCPRPKFILFLAKSMAPVLYICISVFQCLSLCLGCIFFYLCKLEVAMIINPAHQGLLFLSVFLYFCISICFSVPGLHFCPVFVCLIAHCKLEVAMIHPAQQRGYFSSPPPFGQITALRPPVL